jgi:hypothetical protein
MRSFRITAFTVLQDDALSTVIAKLRQVPAAWKERSDVAATLKELRTGDA